MWKCKWVYILFYYYRVCKRVIKGVGVECFCFLYTRSGRDVIGGSRLDFDRI